MMAPSSTVTKASCCVAMRSSNSVSRGSATHVHHRGIESFGRRQRRIEQSTERQDRHARVDFFVRAGALRPHLRPAIGRDCTPGSVAAPTPAPRG